MNDTAQPEPATTLNGPAAHGGVKEAAIVPDGPAARSVGVRLMRDYVWRFRTRLTVAIVFMIVVAASTVAQAWLLGDALGNLQDDAVRLENFRWVIPALILATMIGAVANFLSGTQVHHVGQRIIADLQAELYTHLLRTDLARLNDVHSGRFKASFLNDTQLVRETVSNGVTSNIRNLLVILGLVGLIFYLDPIIGGLALLVMPGILFQMRRLGKRTRKASRQSMEEVGTMSTLISESLDGIRTVRAYGREARETDRMQASVDRRFHLQMKAIRARLLAAPFTEVLTAVGIGLVLWYSSVEIGAGRMSSGEFFSILIAVVRCYQPLKVLSTLFPRLYEGLAAADRIFEILDVKPTIRDAPNAKPLAVTKGTIALDNVSFRYTEGPNALDGLSLEARGGETIALVGPSGAGKSTVLNLIPRFYDVTDGAVRIDGQDVHGVTLASLRHAIAFVTQEPFLFDDTVRANIAYGRPEANDEDIEKAARNAAADDFIRTLPDGYETMVGEQGVKLSGGQRQRIAIARALLADAPILLLDEATSSLDAESERKVQQALEVLMRGRTTLVIAHRLSTIVNADRIYVMDRGRAVEEGTHAELLGRGGLYAKLYASHGLSEIPERSRETAAGGA